MFSLGVIPARGGSKRLERKNIRELCGKPLIGWTIDAARHSELDAFLVTTDDAEIALVSMQHGSPVIQRPAHLATDTAKSVDVLIHAVEWFEARFMVKPTHVALLQPTSPLRRHLEINHALQMLDVFNRHDSLVSMGEDMKPNGCIYVTKRDMLMMDRRIWDLSGIMWVQPYPMVDVDTYEDLLEAEKHLCGRL